jgi:hypothetical protein
VGCPANRHHYWKLIAWNEGRSDKHPKDIRAMLVFDLSGSSDLAIDYEIINQEAKRLGKETLGMWNQVLENAKAEVAEHKK